MMTLTVFLAVCILGCDLLIYFLFQWTLGEKGRSKRRRGSARRMARGAESELVVARGKTGHPRSKVVPYRNSERLNRMGLERPCEPGQQVTEEMVYRRRVAAFAGLK